MPSMQFANRVLTYIHPKVTQEMLQVLDIPISRTKVSEALKELQRGACLGPDGLSRDFFEIHWETLILYLVVGV